MPQSTVHLSMSFSSLAPLSSATRASPDAVAKTWPRGKSFAVGYASNPTLGVHTLSPCCCVSRLLCAGGCDNDGSFSEANGGSIYLVADAVNEEYPERDRAAQV